MTFNLSQFTLEVTLQSLYVRFGSREAWINREPGQPLKLFAKELHGKEMQVWGFGLYAVIPWA